MDHLLLVFLVFSLQNVSFLSLVLDFQGYIHYVKMYDTHHFTFFLCMSLMVYKSIHKTTLVSRVDISV